MAQHEITFGCHTASHPSLPALAPEDRQDELARAHRDLQGRPGSVPSFAYPFGDVDQPSRASVLALGYTSAMEVTGSNATWTPARVARLQVKALSVADLFAQMEVIEPLKGAVRALGRSAKPAPPHRPGESPAA